MRHLYGDHLYAINILLILQWFTESDWLEIDWDDHGHIHQYPKDAPLFKKNLGGSESWDLFSNRQMGLKVQKNHGMLMRSEVEGGS